MIGSARCTPKRASSVWFPLFLIAPLLLSSVAAHAVSCSLNQARRFPETHLADANAALDAGKVEDAIQIYKKALLISPAEPAALHAALAEAYLDQHKSDEAEAEITGAIAAHPHSAILETVLAETQLQQGRPWDAQDTINHALTDDPCYPDAHITEGRLLEFISMYPSAARQYALAYTLAPHDRDALYQYLSTLTPSQRVAGMQAFIDREKPDAESEKKFQRYIERQKKEAGATSVCTLASSGPSATTIPMLPLMWNGQHMRGVGLDVKIDQHSTHLEIDTGSGGLVLSPSAAAKAGLQYQSDIEVDGLGGTGSIKGHLAFAKSVRIGSLEFQNCPVEVYDRKRIHFIDGAVLDEEDGADRNGPAAAIPDHA